MRKCSSLRWTSQRAEPWEEPQPSSSRCFFWPVCLSLWGLCCSSTTMVPLDVSSTVTALCSIRFRDEHERHGKRRVRGIQVDGIWKNCIRMEWIWMSYSKVWFTGLQAGRDEKWRMCIVCFSIYMYFSAINKKSEMEWVIRETDRHEPSSISYMVTVYHSVKCTFVPSVFFSVYNPSFILSENLPLQIRIWLQPAGCLIDIFYMLIDLTLTYFINSDFAFYFADPKKTSCTP